MGKKQKERGRVSNFFVTMFEPTQVLASGKINREAVVSTFRVNGYIYFLLGGAELVVASPLIFLTETLPSLRSVLAGIIVGIAVLVMILGLVWWALAGLFEVMDAKITAHRSVTLATAGTRAFLAVGGVALLPVSIAIASVW